MKCLFQDDGCEIIDVNSFKLAEIAQFAPFFIHQIKGFRNQNYSFLDDLATLDKDLYRNLQYIKVYRLTLFVFFNEVFCELKVCFTS